jgi:transcriptional regulator GlxA family with amidase domain
MTISVGIFLYNDVEVLDFAGPFEVFSTASRVKARLGLDPDDLFNVFTIGETNAAIRARGGLQIVPKYAISNHPPIHLLIIPGGVVTAELEKAHVVEWIAACSEKTEITASVCTGAFLLAKSGLLNTKRATTHWEDIDDLRTMFAGLDVKSNVPWVDEGHVVTSAGISAGIGMSLHLVSRLANEDLADRAAKQMEFDWKRHH